MPIMDAELLFGEAIDFGSTASGSTVVSTNNVYIPQVTDHLGSSTNDRPALSQRLNFNAVVEDEGFDTASGSAVLTLKLLNYSAAITASNMASATTLVTKVMTVDASAANYPDGTQIVSQPLPNTILMPYFAVTGAVATKTVTTGKLTAWIGNQIQQGGEHGAL